MFLTVTPKIEGTILNIGLSGVLDYSTVDSFDIMNALPEGITCIDVDFSKLDFIDSTGIGAIISILHTGRAIGASVEFKSMSEETKELFATIGVFEIKKSLLNEE